MNKWLKPLNAAILAFGLCFWGGAGLTMGVVTMGRLLDVDIPAVLLITDQCEGVACG